MKQVIFLIIAFCLFVLTGCSEEPSEKVKLYEENNEIIGSENEELIGDISETIYNSIDRSNAEAEGIELSPIELLGEELVPAEGRYRIAAGEYHGVPQSGRVLVSDKDGKLLIDELLDYGYGISSVTVDLDGTHMVHVDGIDYVVITPVATELSNELTAGIWEVGKDIEAGAYSVIPAPDFSVGYLQIFEEGETPRVFEFLDASPNSKIEVQLKDGQIIKISSLNMLQFEPMS